MSRITGLIRESVLSWLFGAGATYDAYVLGFRIPNLARELFAEGALSSAFVPTFTRYLATKTAAETRELSNITATMILVIAGGFCALGMLLSPADRESLCPGISGGAGEVGARRFAGAHHVSLPAAAGPRRPGPGDSVRHSPLRRPGRLARRVQYFFDSFRRRPPSRRPAAGRRRPGRRRGWRRRGARRRRCGAGRTTSRARKSAAWTTAAGCPRWRSARTGPGWPPAATMAARGYGGPTMPGPTHRRRSRHRTAPAERSMPTTHEAAREAEGPLVSLTATVTATGTATSAQRQP